MSSIPDFSYAVSKYHTDIQAVYNASNEELQKMCGHDITGTFGTINGKKTYLLPPLEVEKAIKDRSGVSWNSTLMTASIVSICITPMLLTGIIVGVLTATFMILGHFYRENRFKNIRAQDQCIQLQYLIKTGYIPKSLSLNTDGFFYVPSKEGRKYYGPILCQMILKKEDKTIAAYKKARAEESQKPLPFFCPLENPVQQSLMSIYSKFILP